MHAQRRREPRVRSTTTGSHRDPFLPPFSNDECRLIIEVGDYGIMLLGALVFLFFFILSLSNLTRRAVHRPAPPSVNPRPTQVGRRKTLSAATKLVPDLIYIAGQAPVGCAQQVSYDHERRLNSRHPLGAKVGNGPPKSERRIK